MAEGLAGNWRELLILASGGQEGKVAGDKPVHKVQLRPKRLGTSHFPLFSSWLHLSTAFGVPYIS